jgi:predicted glycosyltransferase
MSQGIDIVKLPSAVKIANGVYEPSRMSIDFETLSDLRSSLIFGTAEAFTPDVFIVDKAPLGMKREVLRTLRFLRSEWPSAFTVLGLRDVLDDPGRVRKDWQDGRVAEAINAFYDLILVYGPREVYDPLPEYGLPAGVLRRSHYVGYVGRSPTPDKTFDMPFPPGYVLVAAGGGCTYPRRGVFRSCSRGLERQAPCPLRRCRPQDGRRLLPAPGARLARKKRNPGRGSQ